MTDPFSTSPSNTALLKEPNAKTTEMDLLENKVDLYLGMLPIHNEQLSYTMLADDKWCVIVPDTSPLYQPGLKEIEKFPYPLNLLKNEKYVLTTSQSGIRKQANEFLKHLDIKADVVMESQNISTAAALARKGMGLTFLPKSALNNSELMDSYNIFISKPASSAPVISSPTAKKRHFPQSTWP
ncbi:MAG: hypothetical protein EOM48_11940 [Bacilli bacterium]|nr:hypothetical protein [Bacilli bacterium]